MSVETKKSRLDLRINENDKEILEKAATASGLSLSSYIMLVVLKQARLDVVENETILLANDDRDQLLKILANPPEPNNALKALINK